MIPLFCFLGNKGVLPAPLDTPIYTPRWDVPDIRSDGGVSESMYRNLYIVSEMNVKPQYIVNNYSLKYSLCHSSPKMRVKGDQIELSDN